jgi:hypothetical protein
MAKEQRVIGDWVDPTFEVCLLKTAPGWYVRALWHYGEEQHVGRFVSVDDAQSWIAKSAEGWLRNRTSALRSHDHQRPSRMAADEIVKG